jgi:hypothetical protein
VGDAGLPMRKECIPVDGNLGLCVMIQLLQMPPAQNQVQWKPAVRLLHAAWAILCLR